MVTHFQQIVTDNPPGTELSRHLLESGFAVIPGPLIGERLRRLSIAYDVVMASASGPDFRASSTTTRMSDLLSYNSAFDEVFLYPPLLEAGVLLIGEPFKLSSLLGRTLRAKTPAQKLHVDLPLNSDDGPLLGFILMIDPFRDDNGATRFVPGSHRWADHPADLLSDEPSEYPGQLLACGEAGMMIIFNAAIWHGHTANVTTNPRRSIQGYFVRRVARSGFDFRNRLHPEACARMSSLARYLLVLDDHQQ